MEGFGRDGRSGTCWATQMEAMDSTDGSRSAKSVPVFGMDAPGDGASGSCSAGALRQALRVFHVGVTGMTHYIAIVFAV